MAIGGTDLFTLMQQKLDWVGQRQGMLAQNIANRDTPGYTPVDAPDFMQSLTRPSVTLAQTEPAHFAATADPLHLAAATRPEERAPDGNGVSLEQQLAKVADTDTAQQVTTQLYTAYIGMFHTALGK